MKYYECDYCGSAIGDLVYVVKVIAVKTGRKMSTAYYHQECIARRTAGW